MTVDKELLDILACPVCKGSVKPDEDEKYLLCEKCRLKYEIREEIPIMLPEEAKAMDE